MRPRYLIELLNHCRGYAVNLKHDVIKEDDVKNGLKAYSTDLLRDINLEIRDVEPTAADAPYAFIGAPRFLVKMTYAKCCAMVACATLKSTVS